jgi:ribonuclease Y
MVAKMGGLLHDIGKAVDHEVEGPHRPSAPAIARRHELPPVVERIAAHHQEVEYACSRPRSSRSPTRSAPRGPGPAARPWRLRQAARGPPGDRRASGRGAVFAVQAGARSGSSSGPRRSTTSTATRLARDIVKKIEEQLTYPGQIKVTVIRETRSIDYAG